MEIDPVARDKKKVAGAGWSSVFYAVFSLAILVPLSFGVLIPLGVFYKIKNFFVRPKAKSTTSLVLDETNVEVKPKESRTYDVVLYGASGYTGQLVAKYLAQHKELRWAIAGRRKSALETLRSSLVTINPSLSNLRIFEADSSAPESLRPMIEDTRVVISTAGPFDRYGTPVVALCALHGTSYCDITGETNWVRKMIDKYDDLAKKTGAKIVHFCGHDCIPWDLSVYEMASNLEKHGESLASVAFYDEVKSGPSGGTLETLFHSLENLTPPKSDLGFDPLLKTADGTKTTNVTAISVPKFISYSRQHGAWVWTWVMAMVMANCVRRSNSVNGYNSRLKYVEYLVFPSFSYGLTYFITNITFACALLSPPATWVLRKLLPTPGSGPTDKQLAEGYLKVTGYGLSDKGRKIKTRMYCNVDPGYKATASMLAESGLCIALNDSELQEGGGVLTPASCLKHVLLKRLVRAGVVEFDVQIS